MKERVIPFSAPMTLSPSMPIDLPKLLETRLLVQANSGGGKSWCLRRMLEQTAPSVQQIVIDPEGEFASLREKFDYIICAPRDADAVANPATAAALARAVWESGTSAIVDIYELKAHERALFVRRFLEALVNAPKAIWHPALVVIDEVHMFAPQAGQCESLAAVVDLATRGRKRGLALVGATQRLSKLHKDVAAELLNKLVGRTGLDVDVQRAADELGMTRADAQRILRDLNPGEFFAFGPALTRAVERTTIGAVQTTHPKTGARGMIAPPPPSKAVLAKLQKLEGIQREAEVEVRTVEQLGKEVTDLRRKLTIAEKRAAGEGVPEAEVQRRVREALAAAPAPVDAAARRALQRIAKLASQFGEDAAPSAAAAPRAPQLPAVKAAPAPAAAVSEGLTGPEQRILDAIAWLDAIGVTEAEQPAVAFLAGYSFGGGAYNNPRGRLNSKALVEYLPGGLIRLTDAGRAVANKPEAPGSNAELHDRVLQRLGGPEQRLLRPLMSAYPDRMSNEQLARAAGYTPGAGAFNNPRGRLRALGLIDYPAPGYVAARPLLFPKEPTP